MTMPPLAGQMPALRRPQHSSTKPYAPTQPPKKPMVMRKFSYAALNTEGDFVESEQIAPASPIFENAFSGFARGTLIMTTQGPVAVEDLVPGMRVVTEEFGTQKVMWVGSMLLAPKVGEELQPGAARLTRIMADSFGMARPSGDLMAGPGARILTRPGPDCDLVGAEKVLMPARDLVDGFGAIEVTPPQPVRVFHLCLRQHATVMATGLAAESFHPGEGFEAGMGPNMLSLFLSMFPHIRSPEDFGPLAHPRLPFRDRVIA